MKHYLSNHATLITFPTPRVALKGQSHLAVLDRRAIEHVVELDRLIGGGALLVRRRLLAGVGRGGLVNV